MKTKTKKIAQYSALALAAATVLPMACKKDNKEVDDPEIDVISPNLTVTTTSAYNTRDTILNIGGSQIQLDMSVGSYYGDNIAYLDFDGDAKFQKDIITSINSSNWDFLPILNSGTTIDTASSAWLDGTFTNDDGYLFVFDKTPPPGESKGINGQGDKYVAFRDGNSPSYKYGWMKVNVSADANTLTIKEVAMANVFNKVIKVGAK